MVRTFIKINVILVIFKDMRHSLFIVGSLNDINYMQFSKSLKRSDGELNRHSGNGSFRVVLLSSHSTHTDTFKVS